MNKYGKKILKKIDKYNPKFKKQFNVDLKVFVDPLMAQIGVFDFKIVAFDTFLHSKGYSEDKHGSIKDYLLTEYGKDAVDLIDDLLLMDVNT